MADGQSVAKVLEMLHPMREPPLPASLAPVLVTLAIGCGIALVALALLLRGRRHRADLREAARAALARTRDLGDAERLAGQAALLRRLVRRLAGEDAARLQGAAWLAALDAAFATRFFSQGAGVAYGNALYGTQVPDVGALDGELARLFEKLRGPPSPLAGESVGAKRRRMRGSLPLLDPRPAGGQTPSSDPAARGRLLPRGEKGS